METSANDSTKAESGDAWDFVITFGLLGPPSGTLIVFVTLLAVTAAEEGGLIGPGDIGSGSAIIFILGFLIGLVPAALTGLSAYAMRNSLSFAGWTLRTALVGGVLSALLALTWSAAGAGFTLSEGVGVWTASFAAIGAAASIPPALLLRRRYFAARQSPTQARS